MGLLDDRCCLVTGASRGIGKAIAKAFAQEGGHVALFATDEAKLAAAAEELKPFGKKVFIKAVDLRKSDSVKDAVEAAKDALGGLDVLVNNAGIAKDQLLLRMKDEDWQDVIDVNLSSVYRVTKAAARYVMKSKAGRVINITSIIGLTGNAGQSSYAASKAGIIGFTKSLAKELASRAVTVNAIAPGYVETDMTASIAGDMKAELEKKIPLGRSGKAEEIAALAVFLASDRASYLTGECIRVDGGLAM